MRTTFSDAEDEKLVVLALEYESQGGRIVWKEVARKMPRKCSPQQLEMRLCALKRTYGTHLARFPPAFFSTPSPTYSHSVRFQVLVPSKANRAIRDIFCGITAADIRQQTGKTEEITGELLLTAITKVVEVIGQARDGDVFLDVDAGLGNVVTQFALQTKAHLGLGIEKREGLARGGLAYLRAHASRLWLLQKVRLVHGDILDIPLPTSAPF